MWEAIWVWIRLVGDTNWTPKTLMSQFHIHRTSWENMHIPHCCFVQFPNHLKMFLKTCFWIRNVPFVWVYPMSVSILVMFCCWVAFFSTNEHCFAGHVALLLLLVKVEKLLLFLMCQSIWCCNFFFINSKKNTNIDIFFIFPCYPVLSVFERLFLYLIKWWTSNIFFRNAFWD